LLGNAPAPTKVEGQRFAIKHTIGSVDLIASQQDIEAKASGKRDKVTGLRADYNLSKTTAVYAGYERVKDGTGLVLASPADTRNLASIGLRKSF
jgi:predicted porin